MYSKIIEVMSAEIQSLDVVGAVLFGIVAFVVLVFGLAVFFLARRGWGLIIIGVGTLFASVAFTILYADLSILLGSLMPLTILAIIGIVIEVFFEDRLDRWWRRVRWGF